MLIRNQAFSDEYSSATSVLKEKYQKLNSPYKLTIEPVTVFMESMQKNHTTSFLYKDFVDLAVFLITIKLLHSLF